MKKALAILVVLGIGIGIAYSQGYLDSVVGGRDHVQGMTPTAPLDPLDGKALFEAGDYRGAATALEIQNASKPLSGDELLMLARCHRESGNAEGERAALERVRAEHGAEPCCADALLALAGCARRAGKADEALAYCEEASKTWAGTPAGAQAALELGDALLARGDKTGARRALSSALQGASPAEQARIKKTLSGLTGDLFSDFPKESVETYTVQAGDSLARIATRNKTTVGMLKRVNRLDSDVIHPGQQLVVVRGEVRLEVCKSAFTLSVFVDGIWMKDYLVGTGANDKTPEGSFEIANRIVNPPWYWKGEAIPPGDPRNILGTRWMGFKNKPGLSGFGIHGTTEPDSVPGAVSRGCIRMRNEEVEELFDLVPAGTTVLIRR